MQITVHTTQLVDTSDLAQSADWEETADLLAQVSKRLASFSRDEREELIDLLRQSKDDLENLRLVLDTAAERV